MIYTRVSLDRREGASVRRQEDDARDLCRRQGWEVVAVETDNSVSAYSGRERPGFRAVLTHLREGRADTVVCWALDRLARRPRDLADVLDLRHEVPGLGVVPVRGSAIHADDPSGRLVAEIITLVSQWESDAKAMRVARARQQQAESGELPQRTYGYAEGQPSEPAATAVREAFAALIATGSVADAQRAMEAADPEGPTSRSGVRSVLTRPAYAGIVVYRGAERPDVRSLWQPLVSESDYRRAQAILSRPARRLNRHSRTVRHGLLTGLVVCGRCGATMRHATNHGGPNRERYRVYTCTGGKDHLRRQALDVEAYVIALAMTRLGRPDAQATVLPRSVPDAADLVQEWADTRGRRSAVADAFAHGLMERADYDRNYSALTADLAVLEDRMAELRVDPSSGPLPADPAYALVGTSLGGIRAVLASLMTVTLHPRPPGRKPFDPSTITVEWREQEHADALALDASHRPADDWWEEVQTRVDDCMAEHANNLIEQTPPTPLTESQRRTLWAALAAAANNAVDAETE